MKKNGSNGKPRNGLVAALDVGSTKIACFIARSGEKGLQVIGIGHQVSRGIRAGAIIDMDAAADCIRSTVETAEQMAGENIRQVVVNVSSGEPKSRLIAYEISIAGHEIGDADLRQVLDPAVLAHGRPAEHETIHTLPVGYSIDGNRGVRDPRGMFGQRLGANVHVISAGTGAMRNLGTCIAHCHLEIEDEVIAPLASSEACLVDDERDLGVTLIDMGGGTTSIAVFFDGELIHTEVVPVGGVHVTNDIARGLSTPVVHAERMKTLYGSAIPSPSDDREVLRVPVIGEENEADTNPVPRSMLVGIIRPRIEETFEMVRARLEENGFDNVAGRRVVLTGGASQLPGVCELAGAILDKQVRLGKPQPIRGLAEASSGPAFSTCAGLLRYAIENPAVEAEAAYRPAEEPNGRLGRIGQWFRENF
ncbi:MAG: cell division protein FtsA [Rhodospirillales bacterium]|nr:cell division protein FtsA [Rhodospirillales bacterium]